MVKENYDVCFYCDKEKPIEDLRQTNDRNHTVLVCLDCCDCLDLICCSSCSYASENKKEFNEYEKTDHDQIIKYYVCLWNCNGADQTE